MLRKHRTKKKLWYWADRRSSQEGAKWKIGNQISHCVIDVWQKFDKRKSHKLFPLSLAHFFDNVTLAVFQLFGSFLLSSEGWGKILTMEIDCATFILQRMSQNYSIKKCVYIMLSSLINFSTFFLPNLFWRKQEIFVKYFLNKKYKKSFFLWFISSKKIQLDFEKFIKAQTNDDDYNFFNFFNFLRVRQG